VKGREVNETVFEREFVDRAAVGTGSIKLRCSQWLARGRYVVDLTICWLWRILPLKVFSRTGILAQRFVWPALFRWRYWRGPALVGSTSTDTPRRARRRNEKGGKQSPGKLVQRCAGMAAEGCTWLYIEELVRQGSIRPGVRHQGRIKCRGMVDQLDHIDCMIDTTDPRRAVMQVTYLIRNSENGDSVASTIVLVWQQAGVGGGLWTRGTGVRPCACRPVVTGSALPRFTASFSLRNERCLPSGWSKERGELHPNSAAG
jgi:hypothetical protein